jgi:hypothetical protein
MRALDSPFLNIFVNIFTETRLRTCVAVMASVLNILDSRIWVRDTARLTFIMARLTFICLILKKILYGWLITTTHN